MLRSRNLSEIAALSGIVTLFQKGRALQELGLQRLKESIQLNDEGIAVFDVDSTGVLINRYAPFYFYPDSRYSAGIVRNSDDAKLTVMRNPWLEFPSAPLGQLCAPFGGGGHQRVGSIVLRSGNAPQATLVLKKLIDKINAWEKEHSLTEAL